MKPFRDLSESELKTLYYNFCNYRDIECNGIALMTAQEFYSNFGLYKQSYADLLKTVEVLKTRLKLAHETICSAKRERDCVTVEDWKRKAMDYEYNWRCCSEFANTSAPTIEANHD